MTTVKVSKKHIMEALKNETNFSNGTWARLDRFYNNINVSSKDCKVCAVGAVLRSVLEPSQNWTAIDDAAKAAIHRGYSYLYIDAADDCDGDIIKLLNKGLYLEALSTYYEFLIELKTGSCDDSVQSLSRHQLYRIKQKLIKFVKENFPANLKIDIDGAEPKNGIKVV